MTASHMPASLDAERSILGAVLLDPHVFGQAATAIAPSDFSLESHRHIFRAMDELLLSGSALDIVTLSELLSRQKLLEHVGGAAYVSSLTDGLPRRDNIEHYAAIVRDKSVLRSIIHASAAAIAAATDDSKADEVLETLQARLIEVVQHYKQGVLIDLKEACRATAENLWRIRATESKCIGVPTGLADLDEMTTGFRANEFYVIGARPGQGKTALMCQAILAAIRERFRPGCFSVEVDRQQILVRMACQMSGLHVFDTRDPRVMNETNFGLLLETVASISKFDFFLEDSPRLTTKQVHAIARMWVSKGCDCIFVDYLQKLRVPGAKGDFERVTAIADSLWELARSTGVPVIALSQLRRLAPGEKDRPPMLDDLRSSGEIEQNANAALLIWRPVERDDLGNARFTHADQIIIAKQRSGPAGTHIPVRFDGPVGQFNSRIEGF